MNGNSWYDGWWSSVTEFYGSVKLHVIHNLIRDNMSNQYSINRDQSLTVRYVSMFGGNVALQYNGSIFY